MIFALVIVCLGAPVTLGMRWLNLKIVAADREREKAQQKGESDISAGRAVKVVQIAALQRIRSLRRESHRPAI